jgi:hypothetical protein
MEKLRRSLIDPNTYPILDNDFNELLIEWSKISRPELKGWFLFQIIAALDKKIIDPDIFTSVVISYMKKEKSRDYFPLLGAALRNGTDSNIYLNVPSLGPSNSSVYGLHLLVYAIYSAKRNGVPPMEIDALAIMLLLMGSKTNMPAFDDGSSSSPVTFVENSNYNTTLVSSVTRTVPSIPVRNRVPTVAEWLMAQSVGPYNNYIDTLKGMGDYFPAMVGASISNYNIAFMLPQHIPSFEYLINCQADGLSSLNKTNTSTAIPNKIQINNTPSMNTSNSDIPTSEYNMAMTASNVDNSSSMQNISNTNSKEKYFDNLFANYPLNNSGKHTYIINGEVVGMVQSIQGASLAGFKLFLDAGVECSYFIINRLCYHIAEACKNFDFTYYKVLLEILKICIFVGTTLDTKQFDMMRLADTKSMFGIASIVEGEYKKPKWNKICNSSASSRVPDSLKKLAFTLGLDRDQSKEDLCSKLAGLNNLAAADINKIKQASIARQRELISLLSQSVGEEKTYATCLNNKGDESIPEEYNDVYMSFYREGPNVYCYTSNEYKDMISTGKDLTTGRPLPATYITKIKSQLDILKSLGLDPSQPVTITQAALSLADVDSITMQQTDFASNTIIKILEAEKMPILDIQNISPERLNNILDSLSIYQDLLPRFQPSHQIATFYQAVYFVLRQEPAKTSLFLNSYRDQTRTTSANGGVSANGGNAIPPETRYTGSFSSAEREAELRLLEGGSRAIQPKNPTILINESRKTLPPAAPTQVVQTTKVEMVKPVKHKSRGFFSSKKDSPKKVVMMPIIKAAPITVVKAPTAALTTEPTKTYVRTQTTQYVPSPQETSQYVSTQYNPIQYMPVQLNSEGKYVIVPPNTLAPQESKYVTVTPKNVTSSMVPATPSFYPPEYYATPGSYAKYLQDKQNSVNLYPPLEEVTRQQIEWREIPYASMTSKPNVVTYPPGITG